MLQVRRPGHDDGGDGRLEGIGHGPGSAVMHRQLITGGKPQTAYYTTLPRGLIKRFDSTDQKLQMIVW